MQGFFTSAIENPLRFAEFASRLGVERRGNFFENPSAAASDVSGAFSACFPVIFPSSSMCAKFITSSPEFDILAVIIYQRYRKDFTCYSTNNFQFSVFNSQFFGLVEACWRWW